MAYKERIGATGDSLRIKNNEWYIARSVTEQLDIKVFKVNLLDQIEFFSVPSVAGDSFVLMSQFEALEERVAILEAIVASLTAGDINIVAKTLTPLEISSKSIVLPNAPLGTNTAMIMPANGIPQLQGVDFNIIGNVLSWSGMPYEDVAQTGDQIKIIYMFGLTP
jgi:hypothetical protein